MVSFYPGPSRVHDSIPQYVKAAYNKGILSMNHRSDEFMKLYQETVALLQEKLSIPDNYKIYFLTSATECWEVIAQSLITEKSHHIYNGSFGEKWFDYTKKIHSKAESHLFDREAEVNPSSYIFNTGDFICITQNETSNGTQVLVETIKKISDNNPNHLVAVDATSSMAGIALEFTAADVWFASVQKCFGMPAGLSLLVCSPKAIARMKSLGEANHYNSLTLIDSMAAKWQTSCTPNVLAIYLLMRLMRDSDSIQQTEEKLKGRYEAWIRFIEKSKSLGHVVTNKSVRSFTVLPVVLKNGDLAELKKKAKSNGFLLGEGYGELKSTTFRIANFPALRSKEIQRLMKFLKAAGV